MFKNLRKFPSRILLLFPRYNNVYTYTFPNFKLSNIKSSCQRKSLSFRDPRSWNSLCLNKLLFRKMYLKNLKKNIKETSFIKIRNSIKKLII